MDLDSNERSSSGDPLTNTSEDSTLNGSGGGGAGGGGNPSHSQASSGISIVHVTLPQAQVQSVIQPTSVIQSTPSLQSASGIPKGNIILVSKPNSVIHTTGGGAIQTLQVIDGGGLHEDENTKKRREILARRPSYRKILNELGGCEISEDKGDSPGGIDSDDSSSSPAPPSGVQRTISGTHYQTAAGLLKVIPAGAIQLATSAGGSQAVGSDGQTISALTMTNTPGGGAVVQYAAQGQDGQFFVPVCLTGDLQAYAIRPVTTTAGLNAGVVVGTGTAQSLQNSQHLSDERARKREIQIMKGNSSGNHSDEWDASEPTLQKRELRLLKNREAARECRRKKKEYIKCLENRVAVLENQNKALIEELKSLKELYCSQKSD